MLGCCSPRVQESHIAKKWQWYNLRTDKSGTLFTPQAVFTSLIHIFIQQNNSCYMPAMHVELLRPWNSTVNIKAKLLFFQNLHTSLQQNIKSLNRITALCCVHLIQIVLTHHLHSLSSGESEGSSVFWICDHTCVISVIGNHGYDKAQVHAFRQYIIKVMYFTTALRRSKVKYVYY